jgi:hypothetical protein
MIVEYATVLAYCDKEHSLEIEQIHQSLESWIKATTHHDWELTDYVEFCTAKGSQLELDHYPVYKITEIAAITTGIEIKNTSTDSRNAYVSIDSDSLDLAVIGGDNAMTATLAFADYATLTLMVAAINDEAKGWAAELYDTDYASYPSAALMEINNFFCGSRRGETPSYYNLQMLDTPYGDYTCDEDTGVVYRSGGWASGRRQIIAKYSAYNTVPEDIPGAVLDGVKFLITRHEQGTLGLKNFSNDGLSATFEQVLPSHILEVIKLRSKVM